MKKKMKLAVTAAALLFAVNSFAQWNINWQGSGNWGPDAPFVKIFNLRTVDQYQGTVIRVDRVIPVKGMCYGVNVKLKTSKGTFNAHLGPAWFVENQDFKIEPNDRIEIIGSKVTFERQPLIIATQVSKGNATLKLRDPNGRPLWCGWTIEPAAKPSNQSSEEQS